MTNKEFRRIREKLSLTQSECAIAFGMSGKTVISNIEIGFRNPNKTLVAILRLLDSLPANDSRAFVNKLLQQAQTTDGYLART